MAEVVSIQNYCGAAPPSSFEVIALNQEELDFLKKLGGEIRIRNKVFGIGGLPEWSAGYVSLSDAAEVLTTLLSRQQTPQ